MRTILIVDDSATSRMLFKANLPQDMDLTVHEAFDLAGSLRVVADAQPDLVVVDYTMPEMNGPDVARELIARGCRAKFALLTANAQRTVVDEAASLGFLNVVEKPITAAKIAVLIAEAGL